METTVNKTAKNLLLNADLHRQTHEATRTLLPILIGRLPRLGQPDRGIYYNALTTFVNNAGYKTEERSILLSKLNIARNEALSDAWTNDFMNDVILSPATVNIKGELSEHAGMPELNGSL